MEEGSYYHSNSVQDFWDTMQLDVYISESSILTGMLYRLG